MGARLSQSNIYAISSLVTTEEWDIENILRRFERRRALWPVQECNGKLIEVIPHHANADEPEFLIADDVTEPIAAAAPPPGSPPTALPPADRADDASSSRLSLASASASLSPSAAGGPPSLQPPPGQPDYDFGGASLISPMPSVYERDQEDTHFQDPNLGTYPDTTAHYGAGEQAGGSVASAQTCLPSSYLITREALSALLLLQRVSGSDAELVDAFFSLVDVAGAGEADLRDVLLPLCLVSTTVREQGVGRFLLMAFRTFDRAGSLAIERQSLHRLLTLVNECIFYLGDRPLSPQNITDLVDSVFTSAGKVDGHVNWSDYLDLIEGHPIVEMLCSQQFQGLAREKVFDPSTLAGLEVTACLDYAQGR